MNNNRSRFFCKSGMLSLFAGYLVLVLMINGCAYTTDQAKIKTGGKSDFISFSEGSWGERAAGVALIPVVIVGGVILFPILVLAVVTAPWSP